VGLVKGHLSALSYMWLVRRQISAERLWMLVAFAKVALPDPATYFCPGIPKSCKFLVFVLRPSPLVKRVAKT
jgi:hypothetical protein